MRYTLDEFLTFTKDSLIADFSVTEKTNNGLNMPGMDLDSDILQSSKIKKIIDEYDRLYCK